MAKRVLKSRTQFTSTLENSLMEQLRMESKVSSVPISRILDMAVRGYLEKKQKG